MLVAVEQGVAATWDAALSRGSADDRSRQAQRRPGRLAVRWPPRSPSTATSRRRRAPSRSSGGWASPGSTTPTSTCAGPPPSASWSAGPTPLRARSPGQALGRRGAGRSPSSSRPRRRRSGPSSNRWSPSVAIDGPRGDQRRASADRGLLAPHWPAPWGRDAGAVEQLVIDQVCAEAGLRRPNLAVAAWALPTIMAHGTPEQTERWVAPTLRGELLWCQLFSEPGAGSDLAALYHPGRPGSTGAGSLDGQKVWTSVAARADMGICLARTNPDVPKHRGITYFLVDMRSAGIEVRPLREITGDALFNEVFFDGCFVPDDCVVGEVDGGWRLARTTLANERVSLSSDSAFGGVARGRAGRGGRPPTGRQDPVTLDRLGHLLAEAQSLAQLGHAGHPAVGGRPPARIRSRASASCSAPSSSSGSTSSASTSAGPTGPSPTARPRRVGARGSCRALPDHRRRDQRGPAQRDRRAAARTAPGSGAGPVSRWRRVSAAERGAWVPRTSRRDGVVSAMDRGRMEVGRWLIVCCTSRTCARGTRRRCARHVLDRTDLVRLRRGLRRLQPDAPRRGQGRGGRPAQRVRPRDVLDGVPRLGHHRLRGRGQRPSATRSGSPSRPGPTRSCPPRSWSPASAPTAASTWSTSTSASSTRRRGEGGRSGHRRAAVAGLTHQIAGRSVGRSGGPVGRSVGRSNRTVSRAGRAGTSGGPPAPGAAGSTR